MYKPLIDFDLEMEAAVLGICLLQPDAFGKVYGMLLPECFFGQDHARVYEAVDWLYAQGFPIDLLTAARYFYDRGVTNLGHTNAAYFLVTLTQSVVTDGHLEHWCLKLRELAVQRTALAITSSGIDRTEDVLDVAGALEAKLRELTDIRTTDDWEDGGKVALKLMNHMEEMANGGGDWVTTSLHDLDEVNGGLRPGQLVLIGARPRIGKTAFAGRMMVMGARKGKRSGFITLEMDSKDVFARMVSFNRDIEFYKLDRNRFDSEAEQQAAYQAISDTASLPIFFSDKAQVSMKDIRAKAEKLMRRHGIDILFIDYLQLIEPESNRNAIREQEIARISRGCKLLAKNLKIPVVLLVQLNREADGKVPELRNLRESGSLEQDADIVMMLHREADSEDPSVMNQATLFVRKWRNGSELKIPLHFDGPRMKFMELSELSHDFASASEHSARMPPPPEHPSRLFIQTGSPGRNLKPLSQAMREFDNPDDAPF